MAETIEHRLMDIINNGLFIMTVDGIKNLRGANPISLTSSSADNTPGVPHNQLLGFFANRGSEFVIDKCWASGSDLTSVYGNNYASCAPAFNYGKKIGLFDDKTKHAIFEVHAIVDDLQIKTHYFLMPHRNYLQYDLITFDSKVKWSFQR
jgi:hypothetical protein